MACLVERLELAPGNGDRSLRTVFQAADRQRLSGRVAADLRAERRGDRDRDPTVVRRTRRPRR